MEPPQPTPSAGPKTWRGLGVLAFVVAAIGLPVNELWSYLLVLLAAVLIFTGTVTPSLARWLGAAILVIVAVLGQWLAAAPRIEEGHNIFVVDKPGGALERQLPAAAFRAMKEEFDARYPADKRCPQDDGVCWRGQIFPDRAYAFSADGIYQQPAFSRRVTAIDFSDPIWLRLGATNEMYNWYEGRSDIQRRERRPLDLAQPWRLLMPWFIVYRLPSDFAGSALCWRGKVLWEGANEDFAVVTHADKVCRIIGPADAGKRIFGVAIKNDPPLAMTLVPPAGIRARQVAKQGFAVAGALAAFFLLTTISFRRARLSLGLLALAGVGIALQDSSFFAGFAPQGAGGDGIYYEALGRRITENLLRGRYADALSGGVSVFYANPGMSYLRGVERFFVGDTNLGYTTLLLILPLLTYMLWRRFLPRAWALAAALILGASPLLTALFSFIGVQNIALRIVRAVLNFPIRAVDQFGLEFGRWTANAMEGFGDAASYTLFLIGYLLLVGRPIGASAARVVHAFGAALLMVVAVSIRPPLAVAVGVMLGGAGLACLYFRNYARLFAMCAGFAPILLIPLHNWYFGGVFVLLSTNAAAVTVMTPSEVLQAFGELARLDIFGGKLILLGKQILIFLSTRSGPLKLIGIAVLLIVLRRRDYDPWLRITALALVAQGVVSIFFVLDLRYLILNWYLTGLIVAVWLHRPDTQARLARVWDGLWRRMPPFGPRQSAS